METVVEASGREVRMLGGFELRVDGQPVALQPAAQRLVALVALTPRGVERNYAAYQLWPDTDERRAGANLRSTLWRLHRCAPSIIAAMGSKLRLGTGVWVDVHDGLADAAEPVGLGLLPFHHAIGGELLPDWYDEWLGVERERYRQWSLRMLEDRASAALGDGRAFDALQCALAAVSIDPARNRAHDLVVAAHRAEGNELDARRECARFEHCVGAVYQLAT